jgi:hypothetical protein
MDERHHKETFLRVRGETSSIRKAKNFLRLGTHPQEGLMGGWSSINGSETYCRPALFPTAPSLTLMK